MSGKRGAAQSRTEEVPLRELVAVPVDVGKSSAMVMACDFTGRVLLPAVEFALTREGVAQMLARVQAAVPAGAQLVRVGVEAAGHYHLPMIAAGGAGIAGGAQRDGDPRRGQLSADALQVSFAAAALRVPGVAPAQQENGAESGHHWSA